MEIIGREHKGSQKNWNMYEEEAYVRVRTFDKIDYLIRVTQPVHVFADHNNLLHVFTPLVPSPNEPRYVLLKVHR